MQVASFDALWLSLPRQRYPLLQSFVLSLHQAAGVQPDLYLPLGQRVQVASFDVLWLSSPPVK